MRNFLADTGIAIVAGFGMGIGFFLAVVVGTSIATATGLIG